MNASLYRPDLWKIEEIAGFSWSVHDDMEYPSNCTTPPEMLPTLLATMSGDLSYCARYCAMDANCTGFMVFGDSEHPDRLVCKFCMDDINKQTLVKRIRHKTYHFLRRDAVGDGQGDVCFYGACDGERSRS